MGFPVGYTEVFIPTLFIHTLTLFLTLFKKLLNTLFNYIGIQPDPIQIQTQPDPTPLSALLLRELLPLWHVPLTCVGERCAICLYEFCGGEETRWLWNCKHVFHRECIDRWIHLDHRKCPLCRTPFLRDPLLREFDQRLLLHHHHHHHDFDHFGFDNHFMHVDI